MADDAADDATGPVAKTVKGIDPAAWKRGTDAAKRRGEPFRIWLARAIDREASANRGDRIIPPDERPGLPPSAPPSAPGLAPPAVADLLQAAAQVAAASGRKMPREVATHCYGLLVDHLRTARGLPPRPPPTSRARSPEGRFAIALPEHPPAGWVIQR